MYIPSKVATSSISPDIFCLQFKSHEQIGKKIRKISLTWQLDGEILQGVPRYTLERIDLWVMNVLVCVGIPLVRALNF